MEARAGHSFRTCGCLAWTLSEVSGAAVHVSVDTLPIPFFPDNDRTFLEMEEENGN